MPNRWQQNRSLFVLSRLPLYPSSAHNSSNNIWQQIAGRPSSGKEKQRVVRFRRLAVRTWKGATSKKRRRQRETLTREKRNFVKAIVFHRARNISSLFTEPGRRKSKVVLQTGTLFAPCFGCWSSFGLFLKSFDDSTSYCDKLLEQWRENISSKGTRDRTAKELQFYFHFLHLSGLPSDERPKTTFARMISGMREENFYKKIPVCIFYYRFSAD